MPPHAPSRPLKPRQTASSALCLVCALPIHPSCTRLKNSHGRRENRFRRDLGRSCGQMKGKRITAPIGGLKSQTVPAQGVAAEGGRLLCRGLVADILYRLARRFVHPTPPARPTPPMTVLQQRARGRPHLPKPKHCRRPSCTGPCPALARLRCCSESSRCLSLPGGRCLCGRTCRSGCARSHALKSAASPSW